jgi:hypothetical protein
VATAKRTTREDHDSRLAREIGHKAVSGRIGITLTVNHMLRELIETSEGANPASQQTNCDHIDFRRRTSESSLPQLTRRSKPLTMSVDRVDDLGDAFTSRRHRLQNRGRPTVVTSARSRPGTKTEHVTQFASRGICTITIGFVDDEDVANLQDAGLRRLNAVTHTGG